MFTIAQCLTCFTFIKINQNKANYKNISFTGSHYKDRSKLNIKNSRNVYCLKQMMCWRRYSWLFNWTKGCAKGYISTIPGPIHRIKSKNISFTSTLNYVIKKNPNLSGYMKNSIRFLKTQIKSILNMMSPDYTIRVPKDKIIILKSLNVEPLVTVGLFIKARTSSHKLCVNQKKA